MVETTLPESAHLDKATCVNAFERASSGKAASASARITVDRLRTRAAASALSSATADSSRTTSSTALSGLELECETSKAKAAKPLVTGLRAEEVEAWQRFPFLRHGYRRGGSYWECLMSLFTLHNETVNAWTTFLSILMGLLLFASTASSLSCSWLDFSPFFAAWIGQTLHGPLSCGYHTFMCMSPVVANRWRKLDLTFILVLNTCATYALSYFTFGLWLSLAWTAVVAVAAGMGISSVQRKVWPELGIAAVMLGCHFLGALVYATHWPQRFFPGVFDLARADWWALVAELSGQASAAPGAAGGAAAGMDMARMGMGLGMGGAALGSAAAY
eukprot:XP_001698725.1 predicted protein [Chlamydomonas reinhardtii]